MKIPKSFEIMGHKIKVVKTKDIAKIGAIGLYDHNACTIYIQTHMDGSPLPESVQLHSLYHEIMHCIFSYLNYLDDNANEQKVDQIGGCLHQIFNSFKSK